MYTQNRIANRNNGKGKYHNLITNTNTGIIKHDQTKFHNKDLGLFQMARALNVKVSTKATNKMALQYQ